MPKILVRDSDSTNNPHTFVSAHTFDLDERIALRDDMALGPLVEGERVDPYSLTRMLPAALGWEYAPDDHLTVVPPDGEIVIIAATPGGRLLSYGISEDLAMATLSAV